MSAKLGTEKYAKLKFQCSIHSFIHAQLATHCALLNEVQLQRGHESRDGFGKSQLSVDVVGDALSKGRLNQIQRRRGVLEMEEVLKCVVLRVRTPCILQQSRTSSLVK